MNVIYINLDSRKDRRERMEKQCKKFGIIPHRLAAINKTNLELTIDLRTLNNLKLGEKSSSIDIDSLGAIACFQSHREAWKLILKHNWDYAWILEDDAILRRSENIVVNQDTPFVWLGLRGSPKYFTMEGYPYRILNYDRECFGSHAYCIHASLIPELLENSQTQTFSSDYFLNEYLFFKGIRVGLTDLAYTNEFLSFSDIEHVNIGKPKSRLNVIVCILLGSLLCINFICCYRAGAS
jgi:hypothetical protein